MRRSVIFWTDRSVRRFRTSSFGQTGGVSLFGRPARRVHFARALRRRDQGGNETFRRVPEQGREPTTEGGFGEFFTPAPGLYLSITV